jgi:hypothetical protein
VKNIGDNLNYLVTAVSPVCESKYDTVHQGTTTFASSLFSSVLRIRDVYPGSLISHPGSNNGNKRGGEKKFVVPPVPVPFLVATNISKLKIILEKKKI